MAKWVGSVFHLLVTLFFLAGVYDVLRNVFDHCGCEMSYMYEPPQYKKVPLSQEISSEFPRYGLYLYGEGQYFSAISDLNLEGIPVLYIPGNVGSMKQCRSVASVLLRKAQRQNWKPHFNVFTVNFNEEYAALYGPFLHSQIQFVKHSINVILGLYDNVDTLKRPKSVIVVAHSMGGVVARGIFTLHDFDSATVNSIYSLATPHLHPVISLDSHIASTYEKVNSYWVQNEEKLGHVTFVSVSGGCRDYQVTGAVSKLPSMNNKSVNVQTTMVPRAWISADHQCAVWCRQVVMAVTRSMFDMVDPNTGQISEDNDYRTKVVRHHFVSNSGVDPLKQGKQSRLKLISTYEVNHIRDLHWTSLSRSVDSASGYYFMDLHAVLAEGNSHVIVRTTLSTNNWILGCDSIDCKSAEDLSELCFLTPQFKVARIDAADLIRRKISYLILKIPKSSKHIGSVDVNILSKEDHIIRVPIPHIFSNLWTLNRGYTVNDTLGHTKGAFYHNVVLTGLQSIYHSYTLSVKPTSEKSSDALLALKLPSHAAVTYSNTSEIAVHLIRTSGSEDIEEPGVIIYTDGASEYTITIKPDFVGILGQIIRHQWPVLPSMITFNILLALSYQLKVILSGGKCLSTREAHGISAKPYKLQPFINLVKALYAYDWFSSSWHSIGLPTPDANKLDDGYHIWFSLMPLVMFLFAAEIFSAMLLLVSRLIRIGALLFKCIVKSSTNEGLEATFLTSMIHAAVLAGLLTLSSGLALWYIVAVNFIDLCVLVAKSAMNVGARITSENNAKGDSPESKNAQSEESKSTSHSSESSDEKTEKEDQLHNSLTSVYDIKLSLQLVWMVLAMISLPQLISWIKGFNTSEGDIWQVAAAVASLLFVLHRQQVAVPVQSSFSKIICRVLYPTTVMASIVCLHSLWRLPYFLLAFVSVYVAMQNIG